MPFIPFSEDEQARIAESLSEFLEKVQGQQILTEDELHLLHGEVDYLVEASKRLGRKDWLLVTAGAALSYTFTVCLTAENAKQIFQLLSRAIQWFN